MAAGSSRVFPTYAFGGGSVGAVANSASSKERSGFWGFVVVEIPAVGFLEAQQEVGRLEFQNTLGFWPCGHRLILTGIPAYGNIGL
jgi:hypothetical protein